MLIDPKSEVPIFQQIAGQLRQKIKAGAYRAGEMLPSLRAMAIDIKVNPNTVQRAYDALEREGIVEARRGVGIFVAQVDTARQSAQERRLLQEFSRSIRKAIQAGMAPPTVRGVFDAAMRDYLSEVVQ